MRTPTSLWSKAPPSFSARWSVVRCGRTSTSIARAPTCQDRGARVGGIAAASSPHAFFFFSCPELPSRVSMSVPSPRGEDFVPAVSGGLRISWRRCSPKRSHPISCKLRPCAQLQYRGAVSTVREGGIFSRLPRAFVYKMATIASPTRCWGFLRFFIRLARFRV